MELAFNGKGYHGWQIQPNAISVQEVLNKALSTLLGSEINIVGAGRTDTGVHASHFVAHFDSSLKIANPGQFLFKINRFGLKGIRIDKIQEVHNDLHARFDAVSRTYHYLVSETISPFMADFSWYQYRKLDIAAMNDASAILKTYDDFTSFARLHTDTRTNNCRIIDAGWKDTGEILVFRITADRFLRNMVRAIVGTMADLGAGKIGIDDFKSIIESKDRSNAGQSAPPEGLFLSHVEYRKEDFITTPIAPFQDLISF